MTEDRSYLQLNLKKIVTKIFAKDIYINLKNNIKLYVIWYKYHYTKNTFIELNNMNLYK